MNSATKEEYVNKRAKMIENYIASYIEQTGLKVDEIVLVEKRSDDGLRTEWYCKPKNQTDDDSMCKDCCPVSDYSNASAKDLEWVARMKGFKNTEEWVRDLSKPLFFKTLTSRSKTVKREFE